LSPGASRRTTLDFAIYVAGEEIAATTDRIATIQGQKQFVIDKRPQKNKPD
jgi:hypothetical protein